MRMQVSYRRRRGEAVCRASKPRGFLRNVSYEPGLHAGTFPIARLGVYRDERAEEARDRGGMNSSTAPAMSSVDWVSTCVVMATAAGHLCKVIAEPSVSLNPHVEKFTPPRRT